MSVARTCRRVRIKMKNDPRWQKGRNRDAAARARRLRNMIANEKARAARTK